MGAHYMNVAPRYTAGSPGSVHCDLAERIAKEEVDSYRFITAGFEGEANAKRAEERGLALIVFEMVEHGKGWWVRDWITHEMHWWPFEATCPKCDRKKVRCERGNLQEHGCPFRVGESVDVLSYVGRPANEIERYKHGHRFFKPIEKDIL